MVVMVMVRRGIFSASATNVLSLWLPDQGGADLNRARLDCQTPDLESKLTREAGKRVEVIVAMIDEYDDG